MALRDLIRKRTPGAVASASSAIPASEGQVQPPKIARLAGIALANSPEVKSVSAANDARQPDIEALRPFRFDLVEADIEAGYPASEIDRVNNLTWHLMEADGLAFDEALRIAADIVATCDPAPCEQAYRDVRQLWKRITGG